MLRRVKAIDLLTVINEQQLATGHNEENISVNPTQLQMTLALKVLCFNMSREYLINIVLFDHRSNRCMEYHYELQANSF